MGEGEGVAAINDLLTGDFIDGATVQIQERVANLALALSIPFFAIGLGWNYITRLYEKMQGGTSDFSFVDIGLIARNAVLIGMIGLYVQLTNPVVWLIDYVNNYTAASADQKNRLDAIVTNNLQKAIRYEAYIQKQALEMKMNDPEASPEAIQLAQQELVKLEAEEQVAIEAAEDISAWAKIAYFFSNPMAMLTGVFFSITQIITTIIRFVIQFFTVTAFKVLYCLGPLAFVFSMLPFAKNSIDTWFGSWVVLGLLFTVLNVLDHLTYEAFYTRLEGVGPSVPGEMNNSGGGVVAEIAFYCGIILLYLTPFWLTTKFIATGKADAGRVVS